MKSASTQSLAAYASEYQSASPALVSQQPVANQVLLIDFDTARLAPSLSDMPYLRRDFYKISLYARGTTHIRYAGQTWVIDRPALLFCNLLQPYTCHPQTPVAGCCCLFTEEFLSGVDRSASLQESPLFRLDANPLFFLSDEQLAASQQLLGQMQVDARSDYRHRHELVRNQLQMLIHEALRHRPEPLPPLSASGAAHRLAAQFLQLLEQQFPLASPAAPLALRTPQAFAECLHIHVNHLNRVVRATTGKTTSTHLAERLLHEAQLLLKDADSSVAAIAESLGFADATAFHHFFRKQTGLSPKAFRQQLGVLVAKGRIYTLSN